MDLSYVFWIITDILFGSFCFRNFDNAYSVQQSILSKEYGAKFPQIINYEETGRMKKRGKTGFVDIRGLPEVT